MAEGRRRNEWEHTALIAAQFAEAHRDKKKRAKPFRFDDFYPFKIDRPRHANTPKGDITALKALLRVPRTAPDYGRSARNSSR